MVETEQFVCKEGDWSGGETEGAEIVLGGGVVVRLELMDGGGGRPGLDLKGGGRSGRSFIFAGLERKKILCSSETNSNLSVNRSSYRGGRGGSEELDPFLGFGLVWLSEVLFRGGDRGF